MEVKGAAVASIPKFVNKFHSDGYDEWMNSLSPESQEIMKEAFTSMWYPIEPSIVEPTTQLCRIFYDGDLKGAWLSGRFSAEMALGGIYKVFIKFGSPGFIIKKASRIMPTYYSPSAMETTDFQARSAILRITDFPNLDAHVEGRIGGWIQKAIELSGCRGVEVTIPKSISHGHSFTEFDISWL